MLCLGNLNKIYRNNNMKDNSPATVPLFSLFVSSWLVFLLSFSCFFTSFFGVFFFVSSSPDFSFLIFLGDGLLTPLGSVSGFFFLLLGDA